MHKKNIHTVNLLLLSISVHAVLFLIIFFALNLIEQEHQKAGVRTKIVLQQYINNPIIKNGPALSAKHIKKHKPKLDTKKKKSVKKKGLQKKTLEGKMKNVDQNTTVKPSAIVQPVGSEIIYPNNSIKSSYGPKFFDLTKEEQEYIITNWELTNSINNGVGGRIARKHDLTKITPGDSNTIQFYLHPDGRITEITFLNHRDNSEFDEIIKQTIIHSHMYYNFPKTKTLMQIYISVEKKDEKN